jgi:hypothetical protein
MNDFDENAVARHVRGATVVHQSPFSTLAVPSAPEVLSEEECEKWVVPFYRRTFRGADTGVFEPLKAIYYDITPNIVERLLTEFNWRPRLTGAFFAALKRFAFLENHIGRLLLRSDLCFAGTYYCVALAEFNTPQGLTYLKKYLEYFLTRPDLDYDQADAMGALAYLDTVNHTKQFDAFLPLWNSYVAAKAWKPNLQDGVISFAEEMAVLHKFRAAAETGT